MNKEEKEAVEYYQNKEMSFSVEYNKSEFLKALGIEETEKDSFENNQIRFKTLLNLICKQQKEIKDYETECRRFLVFCRNIRKSKKSNIDVFNQGREYAYIQFLNLIEGEKNWTYEGKYFDKSEKELEKYILKRRVIK